MIIAVSYLLLLASAAAFQSCPPRGHKSTALAVKRSTIMMPTTEPLVPYKAPGSTQAQFVGLKSAQLQSGKLWISQYIDDSASNDIISSLLWMQSESKMKNKIELYLNIPGASLRPALAIYDAINELKADGVNIATINVALCAGMGALISAAGTKGNRKCMANARYLLKKTGMDGEVFRGQATDIHLEVASIHKWNKVIVEEFGRVSGQDVEKIENDLKRDFYLSSDEAVRYGLIDEVLMPNFNKRPRVEDTMLDIGVFSSGQKYQGGDGKNKSDKK
eukprot:scaffold26070_cov71-Cyclotella_meneghiniana.AAC.11